MDALTRKKPHTLLKDRYVFENTVAGERYSEERPLRRTYWNPTQKASDMRERNFYQTRYTYATINLMAGANPMVSSQTVWARHLGNGIDGLLKVD